MEKRPGCVDDKCIARASPSGSGYCSYHEWLYLLPGEKPTRLVLDEGKRRHDKTQVTKEIDGVKNLGDERKPKPQHDLSAAFEFMKPEVFVCEECLGEDGVHHNSCTRQLRPFAPKFEQLTITPEQRRRIREMD